MNLCPPPGPAFGGDYLLTSMLHFKEQYYNHSVHGFRSRMAVAILFTKFASQHGKGWVLHWLGCCTVHPWAALHIVARNTSPQQHPTAYEVYVYAFVDGIFSRLPPILGAEPAKTNLIRCNSK